jgi:hypothetical protein
MQKINQSGGAERDNTFEWAGTHGTHTHNVRESTQKNKSPFTKANCLLIDFVFSFTSFLSFFLLISFIQIYQGLDIITNKVTLEERQLVPHHLIDCASPLTRWTVVDFQRKSLAVVSFSFI